MKVDRTQPFELVSERRCTVALELLETTANGNSADKDTLYMLGGVAMIVFGAGLILSNPSVRGYMSQIGIGSLAGAAMPDIQRYFKLRAMSEPKRR
jgi:hypothetical protein